MAQAAVSSSVYRNSSLFSGYYLDERIDDLEEWDCDEEAKLAFEELRNLWQVEGDLLPSYNEDELLGAWIDEVLDVLGFGTLQETTLPGSDGYNDRLLFDSSDARRKAARQKKDGNVEGMYGLSSAILEAKQYDADFDTRFDENRSYHDASHQIRFYLDRAGGEVEWGILTNGKQWRLYGTKDYATEIYYEVDLVSLLANGNLDDFKYFYAFFRSAAFRETRGTTFLDTVWNESETAAQELGEDLQNNVFTALRVLGEGFVQTNDLDIDPDDAEARAELKEQSLVLLYRLMFVLYAESRGLMRPEDPDDREEFEEHFSLDQMRLDIHDDITSGDTYDDYSAYSTRLWGQLDDLFGLIDKGNESLGIPPYNGGLFDHEEHEFLAENEVSDQYIAEVIHRLGTTKDGDGELVLADYADLDTRHLGTIYEGLLEHEFRIAPEHYAAVSEDGGQVWKPATDVSVADAVETVDQGGLYVVNDDGERKATGAYYTPDYVVSYIVEETIDPLLDEIRAELEDDGLEISDQAYFGRFYKEVQDLKILDPAMGSAHFLTAATGYLTEQVMEVVREQERQGRNEQELRRTIAKECIYGVDINGMAVELGKLSMWLETLAADKPLAFLDHHLKAGNSLIGSDITDVLSDDAEKNTGQITLGQAFARARQKTLGHVMDLMQDLLAIDNDELSDIKSMEQLYDQIRDDPLYQRLFEVANVHTAEQFGVDVPEGVYEDMAGAIEDENEWVEIRDEDWFTSAQALAGEQDFFHWELEYPEIFFGENGEKLSDAGFDGILENPPYLAFQEGTNQEREYFKNQFQTSHRTYDIYVLFIEQSVELLRTQGRAGFIIPNKFIRSQYGEKLREYLPKHTSINSLIDFKDGEVFASAKNYVCIPILEKGVNNTPTRYIENSNPVEAIDLARSGESGHIPSEAMNKWHLLNEKVYRVLDDLSKYESLENQTERIFEGARPGGEKKYYQFESQIEPELLRKYIKPKDIDPYLIKDTEREVIFPYQYTNANYRLIDLDEYPIAQEYLQSCESDIYGRSATEDGLEYGYYHLPDRIEDSGFVLCPDIAKENEFALKETENSIFPNTIYAIDVDQPRENLSALVAVLNSTLIELFMKSRSPSVRGGYHRYKTEYLEQIPVPKEVLAADCDFSQDPAADVDNHISERSVDRVKNLIGTDNKVCTLSKLSELANSFSSQKEQLNLSLLDHLGSYSDGPTLSDIGLSQPPSGSADSIVQQTASDKPNLRVGEGSVVRETDNTVEVQLTARYKPSEQDDLNDDDFETDQWGYTETDPQPALRITDLTETEADLIEAFVPVAVDEAGGFADFRETATKTNSLVDRLRKLTLPALSDVEAGLDSYIQTKERAEELEEKIKRTDELIDEIVYDLYGVTDEEIEIIEEAVNE